VTRPFAHFAPNEAIRPNDVLLFSETQYRRDQAHAVHAHAGQIALAFDATAPIDWSPVWSLRDERFRYLPTSLLYFFYRGGAYAFHADSNGCAAGNTLAEAIVQGFLELVERDAYAIWWYNRVQRPQIDLDAFDDAYIRDLKVQLAGTGRRVWLLDITNDLGIPSFVTVAHWTENGQEFIDFGSGAHFDARVAALRAMTELNQFLSIGLMGMRDARPERQTPNQGSEDGLFHLRDHSYLIPSDGPAVRPDLVSKFGELDTRGQVAACVDVARQAGLDFLVLDQTRPDIDVPVVRVVVPGLRHFYRRFAPGRLYDVPVKLGWCDRALSEHNLNPLHPQT
jgi:ribosomal protein S12 methylthiotransferase accessory factor